MGFPYERKVFSHHILHCRQFHAADVFEAGGEFVAGGEVVVEIFATLISIIFLLAKRRKYHYM